MTSSSSSSLSSESSFSSSSSSSSSPESSSSSSSSSGGCPEFCQWDPILDEEENVIGWKKLCHGCDDDSFCRQPGGFAPEDFVSVDTECEVFVTAAPFAGAMEKASASRDVESILPLSAEVFVRVQEVSDPSSWSTSLVLLNSSFTVLEDSGWHIIFFRISNGPSVPIVTPQTLPTNSFMFNDKVLSAYVQLPESDGMNQYWVPVTERINLFGQRFAQLQTAEWTVLFFREPAP